MVYLHRGQLSDRDENLKIGRAVRPTRTKVRWLRANAHALSHFENTFTMDKKRDWQIRKVWDELSWFR
jgi:hypothetical protein